MEHDRASKRQQELLSFVDGFIKSNGYGPSYREIMRALEYKSVSTVATHIEGLIAKGYLARHDKSARSLEVVTMKHDSAVKAMTSDKTDTSIESELRSRVSAVTLTAEQQRRASEALELLGFTEIFSNHKNSETELHDA